MQREWCFTPSSCLWKRSCGSCILCQLVEELCWRWPKMTWFFCISKLNSGTAAARSRCLAEHQSWSILLNYCISLKVSKWSKEGPYYLYSEFYTKDSKYQKCSSPQSPWDPPVLLLTDTDYKRIWHCKIIFIELLTLVSRFILRLLWLQWLFLPVCLSVRRYLHIHLFVRPSIWSLFHFFNFVCLVFVEVNYLPSLVNVEVYFPGTVICRPPKSIKISPTQNKEWTAVLLYTHSLVWRSSDICVEYELAATVSSLSVVSWVQYFHQHVLWLFCLFAKGLQMLCLTLRVEHSELYTVSRWCRTSLLWGGWACMTMSVSHKPLSNIVSGLVQGQGLLFLLSAYNKDIAWSYMTPNVLSETIQQHKLRPKSKNRSESLWLVSALFPVSPLPLVWFASIKQYKNMLLGRLQRICEQHSTRIQISQSLKLFQMSKLVNYWVNMSNVR